MKVKSCCGCLFLKETNLSLQNQLWKLTSLNANLQPCFFSDTRLRHLPIQRLARLEPLETPGQEEKLKRNHFEDESFPSHLDHFLKQTMLKLVLDRVFCFQKHALYKSERWFRDINSFQTFSGLYGMIVPSTPPRILENRPAQPLHIPCSSLGHVPLGTTASMFVWFRCYGISIIIHDCCYYIYSSIYF